MVDRRERRAGERAGALAARLTRMLATALRPRELRQALERRRLRRLPRCEPTVTTLLGEPLSIVDGLSFLHAYQQIFEDKIYSFRPSRADPRILDCGANVGLATLFWKKQFPEARITAFEADPKVFQALSKNCDRLPDVRLVGKAVWTTNGRVPFWQEGADAGRVPAGSWDGDSPPDVGSVRLRDYLDESVDLLKIDIEGAEVDVLIDCADRLETVERVMVEYHSLVVGEQRLDELCGVLRRAGFRIHVQPELVWPQPFLQSAGDAYGMDMRLNLYAYRS